MQYRMSNGRLNQPLANLKTNANVTTTPQQRVPVVTLVTEPSGSSSCKTDVFAGLRQQFFEQQQMQEKQSDSRRSMQSHLTRQYHSQPKLFSENYSARYPKPTTQGQAPQQQLLVGEVREEEEKKLQQQLQQQAQNPYATLYYDNANNFPRATTWHDGSDIISIQQQQQQPSPSLVPMETQMQTQQLIETGMHSNHLHQQQQQRPQRLQQQPQRPQQAQQLQMQPNVTQMVGNGMNYNSNDSNSWDEMSDCGEDLLQNMSLDLGLDEMILRHEFDEVEAELPPRELAMENILSDNFNNNNGNNHNIKGMEELREGNNDYDCAFFGDLTRSNAMRDKPVINEMDPIFQQVNVVTSSHSHSHSFVPPLPPMVQYNHSHKQLAQIHDYSNNNGMNINYNVNNIHNQEQNGALMFGN